MTAQLKENGVHTALDLARLDPAMVRERWSRRYWSARCAVAGHGVYRAGSQAGNCLPVHLGGHGPNRRAKP
jgi:hypothetical protein